ncbi:hypothetical protein NDU88_009007 [Pleurodeles waltl]|uniref:Uncharacterized protein n=1 Tax=Pleurodeles waltl TaxID=8319 RepID=A0AAV7P2L8_PLEWA|nr:hypothetical protein NDU88_009007 [Pleurodeles waltl]
MDQRARDRSFPQGPAGNPALLILIAGAPTGHLGRTAGMIPGPSHPGIQGGHDSPPQAQRAPNSETRALHRRTPRVAFGMPPSPESPACVRGARARQRHPDTPVRIAVGAWQTTSTCHCLL